MPGRCATTRKASCLVRSVGLNSRSAERVKLNVIIETTKPSIWFDDRKCDVPMSAYPKLVDAAQAKQPARFAIFDLQPAKLPPGER